MRTITVEKRKWDGTVSAREHALLLPASVASASWRVGVGTVRERPARATTERVEQDELWLAPHDDPVVLCSYLRTDGAAERYKLHAACPPTRIDGQVLRWVDLDLDVMLEEDSVEVLDEAAFMEHARTMRYPEEIVTAAWAGIAAATSRFVNRAWPFDGYVDRLAHEYEALVRSETRA